NLRFPISQPRVPPGSRRLRAPLPTRLVLLGVPPGLVTGALLGTKGRCGAGAAPLTITSGSRHARRLLVEASLALPPTAPERHHARAPPGRPAAPRARDLLESPAAPPPALVSPRRPSPASAGRSWMPTCRRTVRAYVGASGALSRHSLARLSRLFKPNRVRRAAEHTPNEVRPSRSIGTRGTGGV